MPLRAHGVSTIVRDRLSRRLVTAASLTGVGAILTLLASSLAGVVIARNGGPEGYGVFVAANLLVFVSSVVCSFGLPLAMAKHAAAEDEQGNYETMKRRQSTVLLVILFLTVLISVAIAFNVPRFERMLHVSFGRAFPLALPAMILCAVISDYAQGIYTGLLRLRPVIVMMLCGPLFVIVYGLVRHVGFPLPISGGVVVFYGVSGAVAIVFLWRDRLLAKPVRFDALKPIAHDILPAAAFTFFSLFSVTIDRWIVGYRLGAAAIGSYAAAVLASQAALRIPKNIAYLIVPASTRVALAGPEKSYRFNETTVHAFGLFAAMAVVILTLASTIIIRTLFGPGFAAAGPVLRIMAPGIIASAISIPFTSVLTGSIQNRFVTYLLVVTLIPRMILLSLFTWWWGLQGTAVATLIAEILLAVLCVIVARHLSIDFPLRPLRQPLLAAVLAYVCGSIAHVLGASDVLTAILGVIVFGAVTWQSFVRLIDHSVRPAVEPRPVIFETPE